MHEVEINCDLGEGTSATDCARDASIMPFISRCNIACGGHAGNRLTMQQSLANAQLHNLLAGAHPGYPDRENFGRTSLDINRETLLESIGCQIQKLQHVAQELNTALVHIKLHGALYNDAEADRNLAEAITKFIVAKYPQLKILGLANAEMERAARRQQHPFIREGFMDRRYLNDRQLAPRSQPNSVIQEFDQCLEQALCLTKGLPFPSITRESLQFSVDSICLHGDNPDAPAIARRLAEQLAQHAVKVR